MDRELIVEDPRHFRNGGASGSVSSKTVDTFRGQINAIQASLFGLGTHQHLEEIRDAIRLGKAEFRDPSFKGIPGKLVLPADWDGELPPRLMPWKFVLKEWANSRSSVAKELKELEFAKLRDHFIDLKLVEPILPEGFSPWLVSVGIDPGRIRNPEEGYTTLLLIAAPDDWSPKAVQPLHGRFGEMDVVRLDGLVMRVPRTWWGRWAYMALKEGALYVVLPERKDQVEVVPSKEVNQPSPGETAAPK